MKGRILYFIGLLLCVGVADAAVRDQNSITRSKTQSDVRTVSAARSATSRQNIVVNRTAKTNTAAARSARTNTQHPVSGTKKTPNKITSRSVAPSKGTDIKKTVVSRSAVIDTTNNLGDGYTTCRDAYFTCMDQFCGTINETYRRCVCSSKLDEIQSRERALAQTATQIEDFKSLNLEVIDKTAKEVNAMISASEGELAQESAKDTSDSAKALDGISDVLANTKKQSLSTQGTLDIAGDISSIWNTTSLAGGTLIANLTGEALYNAVHAQCVEMVTNECSNAATRSMVVSAYGMYIENDCSLLVNGLDKKQTIANTSVRETKYELGDKRLENYNYHNSAPINDCIAQVRKDITSNYACGTDYVHCLDVTGLYLNYETGEPIYSSRFFELNNMTSMDGDLLVNQANRMTVLRLRNMRNYAERGLDTCRDISDTVWDEFLRQAITEIHQGQQDKIRQVKDECMEVVNKCYDEQNKSLKDFTNTDEALLLGARLELSEKMCQEKLDACSNVYGGMTQLVSTMHEIVDQQIGQECKTTLENYLAELCAVRSNDTYHNYPYSCRTYSPGNASDALSKTPTTTSVYYKLTEYAKQTCVRPTENDSTTLPGPVLQDISIIMSKFKSDMANELAKECERQTGKWQIYAFNEKLDKQDLVHNEFYTETAANNQWGWCASLKAIWKQACENYGGVWINDTISNTANYANVQFLATFYNDFPGADKTMGFCVDKHNTAVAVCHSSETGAQLCSPLTQEETDPNTPSQYITNMNNIFGDIKIYANLGECVHNTTAETLIKEQNKTCE